MLRFSVTGRKAFIAGIPALPQLASTSAFHPFSLLSSADLCVNSHNFSFTPVASYTSNTSND